MDPEKVSQGLAVARLWVASAASGGAQGVDDQSGTCPFPLGAA